MKYGVLLLLALLPQSGLADDPATLLLMNDATQKKLLARMSDQASWQLKDPSSRDGDRKVCTSEGKSIPCAPGATSDNSSSTQSKAAASAQ